MQRASTWDSLADLFEISDPAGILARVAVLAKTPT